MTYFQDLSAYSYRSEPDVIRLLDRPDTSGSRFFTVETTMRRVNVGWLSPYDSFGQRSQFPTGSVSDEVLDALVDVIEAQAVNVMRGFHICEFCPARSTADEELRFLHRGRTVLMGNGEIRIPAAGDVLFAAPTLIGHYVRDHKYLPPTVFLDALLAFRQVAEDLAQGWFSGSSKQ